MSLILVLALVGVLLAFIGYLSLQLYISRRILDAFQRSAIVIPTTAAPGSGLKSGLVVMGLVLSLGFVAMMLVR